VQALLALAPALAWLAWLRGATAQRYEPGVLFSNLGTNFRFDQRDELTSLAGATGELGALLVLGSILLGCFAAGGWLQVFLERTQGESVRRFCYGGARYFWRFARLAVLSLLVLAFVGWLAFGAPWNRLVLELGYGVPRADWAQLETLESERTVVLLGFAQSGLHALLVGLVFVWGDYTRTRLALHDTSSALWAGLATAWTLARHPLRTLRPHAALFLAEAALVVGLGLFARSVEGGLVREERPWGVAVLCATLLAALVWRVILRGARYHAAIAVSRAIVRPLSRPDPWKGTIGGPGGPRYPLGGDEYSVSL
jgi:hypothetical protein